MRDYRKFNQFDNAGFQQIFTIAGPGPDEVLPETRAERLARWEKSGSYDPNCPTCAREVPVHPTLSPFMPSHKASSGCRSGGRNHCTCDSCF